MGEVDVNIPKKISVIVPVYKAEAYLPACVESVLTQTYVNLELILVDDGSPDDCPVLCDTIAERDERVKVLHQRNQGAAVARNTGMDAATGDYILFCDSDDLLSTDACEKLLNAAERNAADIACGRIKWIDEHHKTLKETAVVEEREKIRFSLVECSFIISYLYRKGFLLDNNVRFENYPVSEDVVFIAKAMAARPEIAVVRGVVYYYLRRECELENTLSTRKDTVAQNAAMETLLRRVEVAQEQGDDVLERYFAFFFSWVLYRCEDAGTNEGKRDALRWAKWYAALFLRSKEQGVIVKWVGMPLTNFLVEEETTFLNKFSRCNFARDKFLADVQRGGYGVKQIHEKCRGDFAFERKCVSAWLDYKKLLWQECRGAKRKKLKGATRHASQN